MPRQRLFIVSLPRSGSTVLTTMLDRYEDILCLPESHFPAFLESLGTCDWKESNRLAACFVASCTDGSPLTLDEARKCVMEDRETTLDAIANAIAIKCGRDFSKIKVVVWKSTRLVGTFQASTRRGERYLVLRRNPLNVFESQFRVPFGQKNRSPARFALFEASYEAAYRRLPPATTLQIEYPRLPDSMKDILEWCGTNGVPRQNANSGVAEHSGKMPWHTEINKPFKNTDAEKMKNLHTTQLWSYHLAHFTLWLLPFLGRLARNFADRREIASIYHRADVLISSAIN